MSGMEKTRGFTSETAMQLMLMSFLLHSIMMIFCVILLFKSECYEMIFILITIYDVSFPKVSNILFGNFI